MIAAVALTLTLQMTPAAEAPATYAHVPWSVLAEGPSHPKLRSWTWTVAGGYGLATFGAGVGALYASNNRGATPNPGRANLGMAIGALGGLIPGLLLGNEARHEESQKARAYLPIVDVLGSLAAIVGYVASH